MQPQQVFEIDLEREAIRYENEWVRRNELVERIKQMIDQHDYRIAQVSLALEFLEDTIQGARAFEVKLVAAEAAQLDRHAGASGLTPESFLRQAVLAYMAAQPPPAPPQAPATEPKVQANESRPPAARGSDDLGDNWFKKD